MSRPHHIVWQNSSPLLRASVEAGRLDQKASGGVAYEYQSVRALQQAFQVEVDAHAVRRPQESIMAYWARMWKHRPKDASLVVETPRSAVFGAHTAGVPAIAVIHHIDYTRRQRSLKHRWYFRMLLTQIRRLDAVVTVSEFWRRELERLGCQRVEVIYNAFDPAEYALDREEVEAFRATYELPSDRALVYIGNAGRLKGAEEVYHALKDEGYTLVMSGRANDTDVPARWFDLPRRDYLRLLAACDVVICMSTLLEGWNRVAHEAMLCRTPVIGSGAGGMRELLEGGGQVVLEDVAALPEVVRSVLVQRAALGEEGRAYAEQFDDRYFKDAWITLTSHLMAVERERVSPGSYRRRTYPSDGPLA